MDLVEQAPASAGEIAAPADAAEVPVQAPGQEQVAAGTPEQEPEPVAQVCKNCGYHDASGEETPRCPACYFRHASQPVHQAPVKKAEDTQAVPVEDAKAEEARAGEEAAANAKQAEEIVDGQTVRVIERTIVVEKAPAHDDAAQDATRTVEEQG